MTSAFIIIFFILLFLVGGNIENGKVHRMFMSEKMKKSLKIIEEIRLQGGNDSMDDYYKTGAKKIVIREIAYHFKRYSALSKNKSVESLAYFMAVDASNSLIRSGQYNFGSFSCGNQLLEIFRYCSKKLVESADMKNDDVKKEMASLLIVAEKIGCGIH